MSRIPDSVREFLATGPFAHVVTLRADGTPHVSLAWAGVDGDQIVWSTFSDQRKIDHLRRDARIVLSFQAPEFHGQGLYPYLVIEGRVARIDEGGALAVMDSLAEHYIGPGAQFPMRDVQAGLTIHLTPERFYGQGPWKEQLAEERRQLAER